VREQSVHPRLQSGARARPLSFTVRRMGSVLPPNLEQARLTIARVHNRLMIGLLLGLFVYAFVCVLVLPRPWKGATLWLIFIPIAALEFYGIFKIFEFDKVLSRRLGFVCPHCQAPLYEPRGFINVTGLCPKCRKSVVSR